MKPTAIYARVSSKSQDTKAQENELNRWIKSQDGELLWYRDKFTGRTMDRPGWNRLWADVEAGKIGRIVVWRIDRLGRTASGLAKLFEELVARKIGLLSLRDSIDLETASGRLMANVLASVACYETEVRRERQQAGIDAARKAGKTWGGSKAGRLLTVTQEQITQIQRLHAEGEKVARIARAVGVSRPTVYRFIPATSA